MAGDKVRIGSGAGFAGDRWEPAVELVEQGGLDYIAFECLAERTIARETLAVRRGQGSGYNPQLEDRMRAVLPPAAARGVRVLSNMGAADPLAAGRKTSEIAGDLGLADRRCAVLLGDDVQDAVAAQPGLPLMETGAALESILPRMASANAYLGADAVASALATGAPAVVTGRVADPSLFVGPIVHALGWSYDDYTRLAQATAAGHLLECAGQVSGGYFADPGVKDVPGLARLGFPFADVTAEGDVTIGKCTGTGGRIDAATCTEQLLYEVEDPAGYVTPDCVLDMTGIAFREVGPDRVAVSGARARSRTPTYKVSVGYFDGYLGEGQLSYGGPQCCRARPARRRDRVGEAAPARLRLRRPRFPPDRHRQPAWAWRRPARALRGQAPRHRPHAGQEGGRGRGLRGRRALHQRAGGRGGGRRVGPRNPRGAVGPATARSGAPARRGGGGRAMLTVRDLAHARAGDKGRSVNISVIAYDEAGYERLLRELTEARVAAAFASLAEGPVRRYALPGLGAFNFVIERVQGGGVTATGALDIHGKSLSSLMLTIPLPGNEPEV